MAPITVGQFWQMPSGRVYKVEAVDSKRVTIRWQYCDLAAVAFWPIEQAGKRGDVLIVPKELTQEA